MQNPPTLSTAIGLLLVWVALQIVLGNLVFMADNGWSEQTVNQLIALLSTLAVIALVMHHCQLRLNQLFDHSGNRLASTATLLFPPVTLVVLGSFGWFTDIQYWYNRWVPEDPDAWQQMQQILAPGIGAFLAVVVFAPVLEEVIFRGIFLRGFLHHYPPLLAISLSATLFALMHFNIYQFLLALVMGLFLGWLYYHSRSLWPAIFAHGLYNLTSYINAQTTAEPAQFNSLTTNLLSLAVSVAGVLLLLRIFSGAQRSGD